VSQSSTGWATLGAGDRGEVVDVPQDAKTLYVRVRTADADQTRAFDIPVGSLERPPEDVDYEAELVLEGDRCP
jgi:hypothetical protein